MQTHVQLYGVGLHMALFSIIILNKISRIVLIYSDSHLSSVLPPYLTKEVFLVESAYLVSKKNTICITDGCLHELSVLLSKLAAGCDHVPITGWMSSLKKWLVWFFLNLQSCLLCLMKHFVHIKGFLSILVRRLKVFHIKTRVPLPKRKHQHAETWRGSALGSGNETVTLHTVGERERTCQWAAGGKLGHHLKSQDCIILLTVL